MNILIFSYKLSKTVSLFLDANVKGCNVFYKSYFDSYIDISEFILSKKITHIYFRSFLFSPDKNIFLNVIRKIKTNFKNLIYIDKFDGEKDISFEDKWKQYGLLKRFMPYTEKLSSKSKFNPEYIIKKRFSSRGKDIYFDLNEVSSSFDSFIIQEMIFVKKEYRVYTLFEDVLNIGSFRSSKTKNSKVKVLGSLVLPENVVSFAESIVSKINLDLTGMDIVETIDGQLFLLEVNRSCCFSRFYEVSGINVAKEFLTRLKENKYK